MSNKLNLTGEVVTDNSTNGQPPAPAERRIARWPRVIFVVLLLFVGFLVIGLRRQLVSEQRATGVAPDFEFTTFAGEQIRLADLRGKGVVLNFWASWCVPCRAESPLFEAVWRRERNNGIVFIGLDYLDQEYAAKAFLTEFDITYPTGPDLQSAVARRYGISGVPETFFIDPDGKIASMVLGPITDPDMLDQRLASIRPRQ